MEERIEGENTTVKRVMGWKCFCLLYLPCISSAFNCKLKNGRSNIRQVYEGFNNSCKWRSACALPSFSLEHGLNNTLSDVYFCLVGDKWRTVTRNGTYIRFLSGVSNQADSVYSGNVGVIVAITC